MSVLLGSFTRIMNSQAAAAAADVVVVCISTINNFYMQCYHYFCFPVGFNRLNLRNILTESFSFAC